MASIAPLSGSVSAASISVEGEQPPPKKEDHAIIRNVVGPSYFNTLGIPLKRGRDFSASDTEGANRVVIISESLSRIYWHGANPVGRRMKLGSIEEQVPWLTVVGVVGEVHAWNLEGGSEPEIYVPHAQSPNPTMTFLLRSSVAPSSLIGDVRREIAVVDPNQPVFGLRTMNEMFGEAVGPHRYRTYLTAGFAGLALLLTVIGIYGVMSFFVSERIKEIGIRMALGAHRTEVVGMVLRRGMTLALAGIAIGLVAAFAVTRFITTLLFEVKPTDPTTLIFVSILLAAFSFAATYVPARRATRVDPMIALRDE
jgi:predicted permease